MFSLGLGNSNGSPTPSALHFLSMSLSNLSGVIGNSAVLTPIASYTALQTAGRIGKWTFSRFFRPEWPFWVIDSTIIENYLGISCTLGIL